jgi:hypothetical protein
VVEFATPFRSKEHGRLVTPAMFEARHLLGNLIRRVSLLSYFHTDRPLETDFRALKHVARSVSIVERDLAWSDWTRWSGRQRTTMQMGGLVGTIRLDLRSADAVWPYLWLGQWLHAGKGCTMGLGALRLRSPSRIDPESVAA